MHNSVTIVLWKQILSDHKLNPIVHRINVLQT